MNILITGGASGLGRAITEICASDFDNYVYFTYNKNITGTKELEEKYTNVKGIQLDFKNNQSIANFVEMIPGCGIDVLVNNAYVGEPQGTHFHKTEVEYFTDSFRYNIVPVIQITQKCITEFRKKKFGKIINILTASLIDLPPSGYSIYSATKAYIAQLSKCWVKENAKFNITSNCILPEFMETSFSKVDERFVQQMQQTHPLKKLLEPSEVANIVYTIIKASQQLNGVNIPINAGLHIY